jgi:hypothetical protein
MNWLHFILWTAGIYFLYYPAMILYDFKTSGRAMPKSALNELTFSESILPQQVEHLPDKTAEESKTQSPIIGSGGVTLKNLFGLCRQEAILYTRPVSF